MIFDQTFSPTLDRTIITHRSIDVMDCDCVSFCIVRDGFMRLITDNGVRPLSHDDRVLPAPHTPISYLPLPLL